MSVVVILCGIGFVIFAPWGFLLVMLARKK